LNQTSVDLVKAAKAHCEVYVVEAFRERIHSASCPKVTHVLTQLLLLYAANGISLHAAEFIEDGYMSSSQLDVVRETVLQLLTALRPNAVALVDAFDFTDRLLGSVLGRYDGQVYDNLYKWALNSPLNKTQVHESRKFLQSLSAGHSKL
jgi:acyl-CoA oxidase